MAQQQMKIFRRTMNSMNMLSRSHGSSDEIVVVSENLLHLFELRKHTI